MRVCRVCSSTDKEFKIHSGNTRKGICKECHNEMTREYFLASKLVLIRELNEMRTRLASAEEALGFYANIESWEATGWDAQDLIDESDIQDMPGEDLPKGGKRARMHFGKFPPGDK